MFLLQFRLGELVGCGIKFRIQWVRTWNTFDGSRYPKNKKYLKKRDDDVKTQGDMSKIRTKKVVFYDTYPQIYIKKVFKTYKVF